ncbi:ribosomal RNA large subunit methyltransferase J [Peptostreptococcaceae bacterium AS15]|nr:ribosomal RNA large subunit methyltransferase J [Peptostreptococcaceae bacterium AS15]
MSSINLPSSYIEEMKELLNDEFDDFISTYNEKSYKGISLNTKKTSVQEFLDIKSDCEYWKVPWSEDSLYVSEGNISKNPLYHTGAFYIQEPSASSVVNFLDVKKGMKVLDMCASPGGKTFQISQRLSDDDILISNDANNSRVPQLLRNIEYHGSANVMITNETQDKLAENFPSFFDRILLDVPCSGEGMFRKDSKLMSSYEKSKSQLVPVQKDLLTKASKMLKKGGKLIYSTCTFNKRENELNIIEFLEENSDFEIINIEKNFNFTSFDELKESARLFPHKLRGEGHFLALVQKKGEEEDIELPQNNIYISREKLPKAYLDFEEKSLNIKIKGNFLIKENKIYLEVFNKKVKSKMRIIRNGLFLGEIKNNNFNISSAFIRHLKSEDCKNIINFSLDDDRLIKYLKGETLYINGIKDGDYIICTENMTVGLGKIKDGKMKNMYNKNWRMI